MQTPTMTCPACRLLNPGTAMRCECGYDFASGTTQETQRAGGNSRESRASALSVLSCWLTIAATAFAGVFALSPYSLAMRMITAQVAEIVGPFMLAVNLGRILPFVLPVVVALLPILFPNQAIRIVSAVLLCALSLFAIASIGLFCIPGAIVITLAARVRPITESPAM